MRTAVLISGRGSNLQALIAATRAPDHPAEIALVLSNRPEAAGLDHAREAGIASQVVDQKDYAGPDRTAARAAFDAALTGALEAAGIELVCLAGFMRVLTGDFVAHWRDRLINIHPSLLPAFPGLDTHARALAAGVKLHGCTVHFVREAVDSGPIIGQTSVPVLAGDTPETLAARVLAVEHRLYPACLRLVAEGRAKVVGERVAIPEAPPESRNAATALLQPQA
jgi:phosphoribosylglycinamide formyltransferase-1